jgi:hypothetical protein
MRDSPQATAFDPQQANDKTASAPNIAEGAEICAGTGQHGDLRACEGRWARCASAEGWGDEMATDGGVGGMALRR